MAVLTISSLTLTSNKYNFVRTAQLYREQKLLAVAKCGDAGPSTNSSNHLQKEFSESYIASPRIEKMLKMPTR